MAVEIRKHGDHQLRAYLRQFVGQLASGLRRDRGASFQTDRSCVEPGLHLHDAHACFGITRQDRALDRRGAPPAREQRSVNVEAAEPRGVEDWARQDEAVGRDHRNVGAQPGECRLLLGIA